MKGLATVKMLREIEKGTGKQIHELFDLICGTSTGGMLAVALGIKLMSLEKCEEIYKQLGNFSFLFFFQKEPHFLLFSLVSPDHILSLLFSFSNIITFSLIFQGKLVFAESVHKENEAATWREKLDQLYKSSSQSFRVVVHGSKVCYTAVLFSSFPFI